MTNLSTIIILLVGLGLGYVVEPMFVSGVNQKPAKQKAETRKGVRAKTPKPEDSITEPTSKIQVDLSKITKEDYPEKVALKVPFTISDSESGVTVQLKAGSMVKPLSLAGTDLIIQPALMPIQSRINVDKTNFKELAVPKMLERMQKTTAGNDSQPAPPTPPEPVMSEPEPIPTPTPEPAPPTKIDEATIVAILKKDVEAGKVTEFKANQVTVWKAGEDTEFDGKTYQTGLVTFKAETILGVQEHEAIALIESNKVYKWMWAKTKLEMR